MEKTQNKNISVVIPAKNEAESLRTLLPAIRTQLPDSEIVLVDDGSTDDTALIGKEHADLVIRHPVSMGNGAAIKSGARAASRDFLLFMDADGQHSPDDISKLVDAMENNEVMVVGARNPSSHANIMRLIANTIYNKFATYMTGQKIKDLTSGFRMVRAEMFRHFLYLLPNGFSYPTTITVALARTGYPITYVQINAKKRKGRSHISPVTDGIRFLLIIFKTSALYSPLKLFMPTSFMCFSLGTSYYLYTYLTDGRFTNMGLLLLTTSLIIFMIGLVSEQITMLMYSKQND